MHSHRYNYQLSFHQRRATAAPEVDLHEQLEGIHRTLSGQRALLELLDQGFIEQNLNDDFLTELTQDLLPVAAFLNETAERELACFWDAFRKYEAQQKLQPTASSSDESLSLNSTAAREETYVRQSETA
jgi:hypothetical protein